ncbi:hypothetical protein FIBSPDRAFT_851029 [Athelia psychrophila]|uniref:Uncharacterized protein n=1 Tax=Athelia psychrophila TaxID=1759441 RepID=A0A166SV52_9AGAM|nr:hypothetical protein FIBSPDRAFT_851029 [Fibularhizoctonia sp. CBS 109695]
MRRRSSPPTALRLATGPTPHRSQPKHVLPALPAPTFQGYSNPAPVRQVHSHPPGSRHTRFISSELPYIPSHVRVPTTEFPSSSGSGSRSGGSSPVSASSTKSSIMRGPWDHSTLSLDFNVENILAPLKAIFSSW